jgi:feruloyl esterase
MDISTMYQSRTRVVAPLITSPLLILASASVFSSDQAPTTGGFLDFERACRPEIVQRVVARLSTTLTVKEIADGTKLPRGVSMTPSTSGVPAYCQISGSFVTNPKSGKTANFLATFPAAWNGKYLQIGCSGHCGQFYVNDAASPGVTIANQGFPGQLIIKGYASFATDEGHEGLGAGAWAIKGPGQIDEDAIEDYYYRADKILARLGKEFTTAFYSLIKSGPHAISRSYFSGCSGGGRDAFVAASYFPEEFDGIIGGSAYNLMGTAFQSAAIAVANLRSRDARIPSELMKRIDPIVKARCDKLDGVEDGLIQNPAACDFRPDRDLPRCDGKTARTRCFTQAQVETISAVVSAVTDQNGKVVQPGFSVSELNTGFLEQPRDLAAREPYPNSDGLLEGGMWGLANASLKIFVHKNDPNFYSRDLINFQTGGPGAVTAFHAVVPNAEVSKALKEARLGIGHFPENLAKLIQLNRKFLIWHNLSDEKLTPYVSINYYKALAKMHGGYAQLQKNVRLFSLPGTGHCSLYGVGPSNFDALTAIEDWVERGKGPDALIAKLYDPDSGHIDIAQTPLRTMPLCKFPEMARYSGHGDINDSENWSCPLDNASMLNVGESGRQAGLE